MSKIYTVTMLGIKVNDRHQRTGNIVKESRRTIINRRKSAQRNARLVQLFK